MRTPGAQRAMEVLPGDLVSPGERSVDSVGPGVSWEDAEGARAHVAGFLKTVGRKIWVDFSRKRYVPSKGERVLGVVMKASARQHKVDIGGSMAATLPELAFEGATKRNKQNLQVGNVVYARVTQAHRHMEPELSCVDASGKAAGLGLLHSGLLLHCSQGLARKLLVDHCPILLALEREFKFECTVGMNGRVWVKAASTAHTIAISNALLSSEFMSSEQCKQMVAQIVERL